MTTHDDADRLIRTWFEEGATVSSPDYAADVMALVDQVPQQRRVAWLRAPWKPGPAEAPVAPASLVVVVLALLVLGLVATLLLGGASPKPSPFRLQGIVPVAGTSGALFESADADGVWVTGDKVAIHVDPATLETTRVVVPLTGENFTGVVAGSGSLWAADYDGNRVLRIDPSTGEVVAEVAVLSPVSMAWQNGLWVLHNDRMRTLGLARIDAATNAVALDIPSATAYALVPGSLWYLETASRDAWAVEADPATGQVRSRIPIPIGVAGSIAVDTSGNVYAFRSGSMRSQIAVIGAATHEVSETFVVPHDFIGGIVPVGDSVWGAVGPGADGRSRLVEIGPAGPTGREEDLAPGLDPDTPVVAFGSLWIPFDGHAALYRYPADALAP